MADSNEEVLARWGEAIARGESSAELWDPRAEVVNAKGWVVEATYHGREGVRQWWREMSEAFSDAVLEVEEVERIDEETFLTVQRLKGHFRTTGIPMNARWASILTVREGLIVRAVGYLSKSRAQQALKAREP